MPADDYEYGSNTIGVLAIGGSANGNIEAAGDQDSFAVALQAGHDYTFNLNLAAGTLGVGSIWLLDGNGTTLASGNWQTGTSGTFNYRPAVD